MLVKNDGSVSRPFSHKDASDLQITTAAEVGPPTTSQGTPTTSVVVASCWTDFGAELAVDGALATAEATCFGAPAWGDVTNQTYANRFLVCKARAT